jgi:hypothetical protein
MIVRNRKIHLPTYPFTHTNPDCLRRDSEAQIGVLILAIAWVGVGIEALYSHEDELWATIGSTHREWLI